MIPPRNILAAFMAGVAVTLTRTPDSGAQHGADRWQFAALRLSGDTVLLSAPGANAWRPLREYLDTFDRSAPIAQATASMAAQAYDALTYAYHGAQAQDCEGYEWLVSVTCEAMVRTRRGEHVPCGKLCVHPLSIRAKRGPKCRGEYDAQARRRAEKSAAVDSFIERMRARAEGRA